MLGFGGRVAVSLICWALVAVWLSVSQVGKEGRRDNNKSLLHN